MMNKTEARDAMKAFLNKYRGKTVFFNALSNKEKLVFVMVDQFNYFHFLKLPERMARAIHNAYGHKESNFKFYSDYDKHMIIARR